MQLSVVALMQIYTEHKFFNIPVIQVAKQELARECDYVLEASNQKRYKELLCDTDGFYVPKVIDELSSKKVLTSEFVRGICSSLCAMIFQCFKLLMITLF